MVSVPAGKKICLSFAQFSGAGACQEKAYFSAFDKPVDFIHQFRNLLT